MAKGLIGRKLGMTQVFVGGEELIPVTVVQAGPCTVIQKRTRDVDGYDAIQIGFEEVKPHRANKPTLEHFERHAALAVTGKTSNAYLQEFEHDDHLGSCTNMARTTSCA